MQFVVIAYDGTDPGAPERRAKAREAHLAVVGPLKEKGRILLGGAILNEDGGMIGSVVVADFPSRAELDAWIAADPYVTGDVWREIRVHPYRVAL